MQTNITTECLQHYADIKGMPMSFNGGFETIPHTMKMTSEIAELYRGGKKIYTGRNFLDDADEDIVSLIINDTWVIVYNESLNMVINCYQIDLGLGVEFNRTYIKNYLDKLEEMDECVAKRKEELLEEQKKNEDALESKKETIKGYQKLIQDLRVEMREIERKDQKVLEELDTVDATRRQLVGSLVKDKIR